MNEDQSQEPLPVQLPVWPSDRLTLSTYCEVCEEDRVFVTLVREFGGHGRLLGPGSAIPQDRRFDHYRHILHLLNGEIHGAPRCQQCHQRILATWTVRDGHIVSARFVGIMQEDDLDEPL